MDSMWVFPHAVLWDLQLQFLSTQAGKQPTGVLIHSYLLEDGVKECWDKADCDYWLLVNSVTSHNVVEKARGVFVW